MKKVIRLTETQLKTIINSVIKENKKLDENIIGDIGSAIKTGYNTVSGGIQKGMTAIANTVGNAISSDASTKQFDDRILSIANTIKNLKKVIDPKTNQPVVVINNPQSKVNGMRLDKYFTDYKIKVGEVLAAQTLNNQGGKPLTPVQRSKTYGDVRMRSFANPQVLPHLFK